MNLILQSITADITQLRHIAQVATPQQIIELTPHAIRCINVNSVQQDHINQLAFQNKIDSYWTASKQSWNDFKLLVMDMDSTLITIECIDEIADMQGLKPQVAKITEAAMQGEIEFAESLTRRVALLRDLPTAALQQVYDERLQFSLGAQTMLEAARDHGLKTLLVSGGFTFFTDRLKKQLNLDYARANQLEIIDNKLSGKVLGQIVDAQEKRRAVEHACRQLQISPNQAMVIGDGANDLAMMEIAGLSVAFRAKPVVRAQADVALNFVGLDGVVNLF